MRGFEDFMMYGLMQLTEQAELHNRRKQELIDEFRATKNLPRKRKKQRRKVLQSTWSIICWADDMYKDIDLLNNLLRT